MPNTQNILNLYKNVGETPLECIERFVRNNPNYKDIPMTYAGRLDPMAEGVLIVLAGEEVKNKEKYTGLDKEYEFEILWGFETDTFDVLGKIVSTSPSITLLNAGDGLKKYLGKIQQTYPPYSSKTVNGKPLFQWSREGRINEIVIPSHEVTIHELEFISDRELSVEELEKYIQDKISTVKGDFRQDEVLASWINALKNKTKKFLVSKFRVVCGSGTYVRTLVHDLGKDHGCGATTLSIVRTRVGKFTRENAISS